MGAWLNANARLFRDAGDKAPAIRLKPPSPYAVGPRRPGATVSARPPTSAFKPTRLGVSNAGVVVPPREECTYQPVGPSGPRARGSSGDKVLIRERGPLAATETDGVSRRTVGSRRLRARVASVCLAGRPAF